jgi:hypothetical protein
MNKKFLKIFLAISVLMQTEYLISASGWSMLRKIFSPKSKSVAVTAVVGVRGDLSGIFYNPAVLGYNISREIFLLSEYNEETGLTGGLVYGQPMKNSSLAFGLAYYNAGQIRLSWLENNELKEEDVNAQQDILGLISYGRILNKYLSIGLTLKFATSKLFELSSANAFASDLGFVLTPNIGTLSIAGGIQNIGTASKFVRKADNLPLSVFGAIGYAFYSKKWTRLYIAPGITGTYLIEDKKFVPDFGIEAGYSPISVSLGYQINDESNFNLGVIYLKEKYDIAYSYVLGVYLHSSHRLSIGYRF